MSHLIRSVVLVSVALLLLLSGCQVQRFTVGDGPRGKQGSTTVYSSSWDVFIFWGLVSLGPGNQPVIPPADKYKGYQIKTSFGIGNALVSYLTLGFVQSRTKKVLVYTQEERTDVKSRSSGGN